MPSKKVCCTASHPFSGFGERPAAKSQLRAVVRPKRKEERKSSRGADGLAASCRSLVDMITASAAMTKKSANDTLVQKSR